MIDFGNAEQYNDFARKVNALWNLRGTDANVRVNRSDANFTVDIGIASVSTDLHEYLNDFIWVGASAPATNYGNLPVRDWGTVGNPYIYPDLLGIWNVWNPDGNGDLVWRLKMEVPYAWTLERIELYQVDGDGEWTTGQAWATAQYIYPFAHQGGSSSNLNGDGSFTVFPLRIYYGGSGYGNGAEVNSNYTNDLATEYGASEKHVFYFFGNQVTNVHTSNRFRIMLFIRNTDTGAAEDVVMGTITNRPVDPPTQI